MKGTWRTKRALGLALICGLGLAGLGCATATNPDPMEGLNRRVFWFNEQVDRLALEPVATGWDFVVPEFAQDRISDFFANLRTPILFWNNLLQAKPLEATDDAGRFIINTIFGIGGLFDVAEWKGVPANDEDFGQTLGYWGVPSGAYLVLPLFGPSTLRDTLGFAVDSVSNPVTYFVPGSLWFISTGSQVVQIVNFRAGLLEEIRQNRKDSFDYYVFLRSAFLQNREIKVRGAPRGNVPDADQGEDLYYYDEDAPPEEIDAIDLEDPES